MLFFTCIETLLVVLHREMIWQLDQRAGISSLLVGFGPTRGYLLKHKFLIRLPVSARF